LAIPREFPSMRGSDAKASRGPYVGCSSVIRSIRRLRQ
jgi:hypothetical protein